MSADTADDPTSRLEPGYAYFEGRVINLALSWEEAVACVVPKRAGAACFRSFEAADQFAVALAEGRDGGILGTVLGTRPASAEDCDGSNDWFYLFEHINWGGRRLQFNDVSYYQNLSTYGFDNTASSWDNETNCAVLLFDGDNGTGFLTIAPEWSTNSWMGSYNDILSSIYIADDD